MEPGHEQQQQPESEGGGLEQAHEEVGDGAPVSAKKGKSKKKDKNKDRENKSVLGDDGTAQEGIPDSQASAAEQVNDTADRASSPEKRKRKRKKDAQATPDPDEPATQDGIVEEASQSAGDASQSAKKDRKEKKKNKKRRHSEVEGGDAGPNGAPDKADTEGAANGVKGDVYMADQTVAQDGAAEDGDAPSQAKKRKKNKKKDREAAEPSEDITQEQPAAQEQVSTEAEGDVTQAAGASTAAIDADEDKKEQKRRDKKEKKLKKDKKGKGKAENAEDADESVLPDGDITVPASSAEAPVDYDEDIELPPPLSSQYDDNAPSADAQPTATAPSKPAKGKGKGTAIMPSIMSAPGGDGPSSSMPTPASFSKVTPSEPSWPIHPNDPTDIPVPSSSGPVAPSALSGVRGRTSALPPLPPPSAPASSQGRGGAKGSSQARRVSAANGSLTVQPEEVTELPPSTNTEEHQEVLATKWLSPAEVNELIEQGLKIRQGKYTAAEDAMIRHTLDGYRKSKGMSEDGIVGDAIFGERDSRKQHAEMWTLLARAVPDRPLSSLYHHTKRLLQPAARAGPWSVEEDDKLKNAVAQHGPKWDVVEQFVGRWASDCRDRWRNYIEPGSKKRVGKWSPEEEDRLRTCIRRVRTNRTGFLRTAGYPVEDDPEGGSEIFWTAVAKQFGGTRTRHQCRIKWNDNMANKILTKDGKKVRWGRRDAFIMIMKLASLDVEAEGDIEWRLLPDPDWNWWSPHTLAKRFITMKQRARKALDDENAPLGEVIAYLKREQDNIPRDEVKAFMRLKPGEDVEGSDISNDENEDGNEDGDEDGGEAGSGEDIAVPTGNGGVGEQEDSSVEEDEGEAPASSKKAGPGRPRAKPKATAKKAVKGKGKAKGPAEAETAEDDDEDTANTSSKPKRGQVKKAKAPASATPARNKKASSAPGSTRTTRSTGAQTKAKKYTSKEFIDDSDDES